VLWDTTLRTVRSIPGSPSWVGWVKLAAVMRRVDRSLATSKQDVDSMEPLRIEHEESTVTAGAGVWPAPFPPGVHFPHRSTDPALRKVWREVQRLFAVAPPMSRGWPDVVKRLMDVVGSVLGLIVLGHSSPCSPP